MNQENYDIDRLFDLAKTEKPHVSYDMTETLFLTSLNKLHTSSHQFYKNLFNLKTLLIMTIIGSIMTIAILANVSSNEPENAQKESQNSANIESSVSAVKVATIKFGDLNKMTDSKTEADKPSQKNHAEQIIAPQNQLVSDSMTPNDHLANNSPLVIPHIETEDENEKIELPSPKEHDPLSTVVNFNVTQLTTRDDLEQIKNQAEKAGIQFEYSGKFRKNSIKNLSIAMYIKKDNQKTLKSFFNVFHYQKNAFKYELKWRQDKDGQAIGFAGNGVKPCSNTYTTYK